MTSVTPSEQPPHPAADRMRFRLTTNWRLILAAGVVLAALVITGIISVFAGFLMMAAFVLLVMLLPAEPVEKTAAVNTMPVMPAVAESSPDEVLRRFADALPEACYLLDRRGIVRYANERARSAYRFRLGEQLMSRLRAPDLVSAFEGVAQGGEPARVEFGERVPTERWYGAWFAALDPQDRRSPIIFTIEDLSERRSADRVRVDFVANASHELRTPLASLAGFIETLQGPAKDDAVARERFLKIMQEQAERMTRLVDDLLSLSRVEMKAHMRPSDRVDLVVVLRHVVDALEPLAQALGVRIEPELPEEPVMVRGDRDELTQLFENLVENAAKYGQSGERVVLALGTRDTVPFVSVQDFGPGIPADDIPRLTERFYRVDVEASRRHRGTGLGLAIVKHILARHQARIAVQSKLGEGSTFIVTFPAERP